MSRFRARVLIVEDDEVLREATQIGLERLGYAVDSVGDGLEAMEFLERTAVDLVLLDVMLPSLNGASVTRRVREFSDVPIIIVSARGDDLDAVNGLDAGADDYVVKPVNLELLEARIRAQLRRTNVGDGRSQQGAGHTGKRPEITRPGPQATRATPSNIAATDVARGDFAEDPGPVTTAQIPVVGLVVDAAKMRLYVDGVPAHLTPTEWRLLLLLHGAQGAVVTREELLTRVWGGAWTEEGRVLEVHVQRLRAKIGASHIITARGFGYRFHA